jgi:hypothetical protein
MPTEAQIAANRANSQLSTGPKTADGKQAVSQNNFRHGLTGAFHFLRWEKPTDFDHLLLGLCAEHKPETPTEQILVERMAQHEWLRQRAQTLQHVCFSEAGSVETRHEKEFTLYLRYQTTHERAFHKCLSDLLKLRAEKCKAEKDEATLSQRAEDSRIGFELQKREQDAESRKAELHQARTRLANAKAAHLELDTDIKGTIQAILPGHTPIEFNQVKGVLKVAIEEVFGDRIVKKAA